MEERETQPSNAELAAGGLNPEASFAEVDGATSSRLSTEADADGGGMMKRKDRVGDEGASANARYGRRRYTEPGP